MIIQVQHRPGFAAFRRAARRASLSSLFLALLGATLARPAAASTFTVGGAGCSHADLTAAHGFFQRALEQFALIPQRRFHREG